MIVCKLFDKSDFQIEKQRIGGEDYDWTPITIGDMLNDNIETTPKYLKGLIKYQEIVNSKLSTTEIVDKLNELKQDKAFYSEFFTGQSESIGDLWLEGLLMNYKVPLIHKLKDYGYQFPEDIMNISIEEAKEINGFGEKRLKDLQLVQEKIKADFW